MIILKNSQETIAVFYRIRYIYMCVCCVERSNLYMLYIGNEAEKRIRECRE